ncbi:hypothetical protein KFL_007500030 [Klebsormidium nitens]|uniref:Uncharacterized protein n=1 Tax=Klebsormidium nitens TaxID=105231 RepID=A0A1Y1IKN0_KLENI|nr:hypothetical protein KFL_007500030 [Klebsormidium nitens]|eukprot:GAQ91243.1 hypothetical protein KFL_007500030 [Klebsormidium nitens]
MVLQSLSFWLIMAIHIFILVFYYKVGHGHTRTDATTSDSAWPFLRSGTYSGFLGIMTSFCLVFQTTQSYTRFFEQYNACCRVISNSYAFATALRSLFDGNRFEGALEVLQELHRQSMAMLYLGFGWLPHYKTNNIHMWILERLESLELVTAAEQERILGLSGDALPFFEMYYAITHTLYRELELGHISERTLDRVNTYFEAVTVGLVSLYEYSNMPVPFAVYTLLNVMALGYLVVLAYTQILPSYFYSIIPVFLTVVCTLGLREVSNALADPFGCDDTDIPVLDYVAAVHKTCDEIAAWTVAQPKAGVKEEV